MALLREVYGPGAEKVMQRTGMHMSTLSQAADGHPAVTNDVLVTVMTVNDVGHTMRDQVFMHGKVPWCHFWCLWKSLQLIVYNPFRCPAGCQLSVVK
jgi:hypothetical protein